MTWYCHVPYSMVLITTTHLKRHPKPASKRPQRRGWEALSTILIPSWLRLSYYLSSEQVPLPSEQLPLSSEQLPHLLSTYKLELLVQACNTLQVSSVLRYDCCNKAVCGGHTDFSKDSACPICPPGQQQRSQSVRFVLQCTFPNGETHRLLMQGARHSCCT